MPKYIDADKIPYVQSEDGCLDDYAFRYDINEIPAADVVEVVRCKDCKHGQRGRYGYMCEYDGDKKYMNGEHYCSFGEKIVE